MVLAILGHLVNVCVAGLLPVLIAKGRPAMAAVYGPDSQARRILACLYAGIAATSLVALMALVAGEASLFRTITVVLFPMQIAYKLATWPAVGLQSPVVRSNLAISAVLAAGLVALLSSHPAL